MLPFLVIFLVRKLFHLIVILPLIRSVIGINSPSYDVGSLIPTINTPPFNVQAISLNFQHFPQKRFG